jgi:hypothetical protein
LSKVNKKKQKSACGKEKNVKNELIQPQNAEDNKS